MKQQQMRIWRRASEPAPSVKDLSWFVNPDNPDSPYHGLIGNREAVDMLGMVTMAALRYHNHWCGDDNIALLGPASTGKTTLAKRLSKSTELPFCELHPTTHRKPEDIYLAIKRCLEDYWFMNDGNRQNLMLVEDNGKFAPPPMHVFIDEVHGYKTNKAMINALLPALEGERILSVRNVGDIYVSNIQWTIATTHRGALFGPFDTRFTKIQLEMYSKGEISQIVGLNYPEFDEEACNLAAHYGGPFPREVLAFAKTMKRQHDLYQIGWGEAAVKTARTLRIDKWGMHEMLLDILRTVGEFGTVSEKRLPQVVDITADELEKYQLPFLLRRTPDRPPLMVMSPKGYMLTETGGEELDKRNIAHKGEFAA